MLLCSGSARGYAVSVTLLWNQCNAVRVWLLKTERSCSEGSNDSLTWYLQFNSWKARIRWRLTTAACHSWRKKAEREGVRYRNGRQVGRRIGRNDKPQSRETSDQLLFRDFHSKYHKIITNAIYCHCQVALAMIVVITAQYYIIVT